MSDKNMALLSQSEIDALIAFLNQQSTQQINGDILSQESINKLIEIIKSGQFIDKSITLPLNNLEADSNDVLDYLGISHPESFYLNFTYDETKGVKLFAVNKDNNESFPITPGGLIKNSSSKAPWGACMAPSTFHHIALKLDLPYSEQAMELVKKSFALIMYGDENAEIPVFYLP